VKRFLDAFRKHPTGRVRRYEMCLDCGTTVRVRPVNRPRVGGGDTPGPGSVAL
jgi:hypothetical protein